MARGQFATLAAQVLLLAALVLALLGATFAGALRGGVVPQFRQILAVGPRLALVVENGPFCVVDVPLAACHADVRQEFRVWVFVEDGSRELLSHVWRE